MSLVASLNKLNNSVDFNINYDRLNFLLNKFDLSEAEFLEKAEIKKEQLSNPVSLSTLKKIDKLFNQGLSYYYEKEAIKDKKGSIFLRKQQQFTVPLNFESRKVIDTYERIKDEVFYLAKNVDYDMKRKLDIFNLEDKPEEVANIIRTKFIQIEQKLKQNNVIKSLVINNPNINTTKSDNEKKFMKNIISILDELNIITFEYIPHHSKRDKINFNGCYIKPNLIVIKKESKNYNRKQIFTLLHELGHHLLDCEDIDNVVDEDIVSDNKIENWCNQFAFSFLNNSLQINLKNIQEVYEKTYLSYSLVYTHLKDNRIITFQQYKSKLNEISSNIEFKKKREWLSRDLNTSNKYWF